MSVNSDRMRGGMLRHYPPMPKKKRKKMQKVMHEWKGGTLHSGSKTGPLVKSRKQAIAIGMAEQRKADHG